MRIVWSRLAARDLEHIGVTIARHNPEAACAVVRTLYEGCNALSAFPLQGRKSRMPERFDKVFAPLPYIAVYRVQKTRIEILRIYHTAQHWP